MKEIKMRRYQNLLTVSGLGVIVFAVWSVLKTILLFSFRKELSGGLAYESSGQTELYAILGLLVLIDTLMRLFVGISARSEGFGKKKGYAYIVVAVLTALGSLSYLIAIFCLNNSGSSILEILVSVIVEATSLIVTVELLFAAFTVKKLKKELGEV